MPKRIRIKRAFIRIQPKVDIHKLTRTMHPRHIASPEGEPRIGHASKHAAVLYLYDQHETGRSAHLTVGPQTAREIRDIMQAYLNTHEEN